MRHLASLFPPALALLFVATGPHRWWVALLMLPIPLSMVAVDRLSGTTKEPPRAHVWGYDALLVFHALLHFAILALYLRLAARGLSMDLVVGAVVIGHNTGWSAIIVAHELVHRKNRFLYNLGRALLCTAFYDHFAVEHVRGHHARVGTADDPATARLGESLAAFKRRTIPGQFKSAWKLRRGQVLFGIFVQAAIALAVAFYSPWALLALLFQAVEAVNLLETVNYLEHWGLVREQGRVTAMHSWDTDSAFTTYALIGLARHADHHANASRPYPTLRLSEESPKLPYGYPSMLWLAAMRNRRFQELMTDALARYTAAASTKSNVARFSEPTSSSFMMSGFLMKGSMPL
jgi:alkane 1-monooxygenase